jgi:uncharacterized protein (DUF1697 family)
MQYAAFFRNLNLGREGCPSKAQFEQTFLDAGAHLASSFLTNGTLVFSAGARSSPLRLLAKVSELLLAQCGLVEPAYVRPLSYLADLVATEPFALVDRSLVHECSVSFLHPHAVVPSEVPADARRLNVEVLRFTDSEAFGLSRKIGKASGSPNAVLERLLGLPATTRSWNTVTRLVRKHA